MTQKIQPHTDEELKLSFEQAGCPSQFFQKFKDTYLITFNDFCGELETDDDDDLKYLEEEKNSALELTIEKIERFMKEINFGHCEEWATYFIHLYDNEREYCNNIYEAYYDISKIDKELAKREIQIHSKTFGEDEHFERYFISIFTEGYFPDNPIEFAKDYSRNYKRMIAKGKSSIYAHHYADAKGEYTDEFCDKFAFAMERAIEQELNETQAFLIADEFAEILCNYHVSSYFVKKYMYLPDKINNLSKYFKNIPQGVTVTKKGMMDDIDIFPEEQLEEFLLDFVITYEKNKNCQNKQTSDFVEEKIDLNKEDDSYDFEKEFIDDYKNYKQNKHYKQAESEYDAIWDSMFPEGDDDDSITDFLTR